MKALAKLRSWLNAMTHRSEVDQAIQSEVQFHIESYAADLVKNGMSAEEAMRSARLEIGPIAAQQENCRESLGLRLFDDLIADLRYGLRMLRKAPGFTTIAIASLALGIGANTIIFTLARETLFDRLAVPHPEELRLLTVEMAAKNSPVHSTWGDFNPGPNGGTVTTSFSYPVYQILRQENHSLGDLFAFKFLGGYNRLTATIDGHAQAVSGEMVSGNYYAGLDVGAQLGRPIGPADDKTPGQGAVAVISDGLWSRSFGRSPSVLGKTIALNLTPVTIIGVNPPHFTGASTVQGSPDVFVPFSMQPVLLPKGEKSLLTNKDLWWVQVMGRAKPDIPDSAALAALSVSLDQAVRATLDVAKDHNMPRLSLPSGSRGLNHAAMNFGAQVYVLLALVGLVLLLACANIATLLLARSAARQREVSVRMALGATRQRILRQVLTESLLLSLLGGVAGFLLGYFGRRLPARLMFNSWDPPQLRAQFDWKVFAFTACISVVTGLLFGLAPALQSTRTSVNSSLKDNQATSTRRRKGLAGKAIVVFQISLSLLLVIGAGLFARTLFNLNHVNIGFRPENILLFHLQPPHTRYKSPADFALFDRLEDQLSAIPSVDSLTLSAEPLLAHDMSNYDFTPDDLPPGMDEHQQVADVNFVGDRFVETIGMQLVAGRTLNRHDTQSSPKVAIVNQTLAKKFFPKGDPVGKTFKTFGKEHVQVVGIVADARYDNLRGDIPATFYVPYRQLPPGEMDGGATFELHLRTTPESALPAIRQAVAAIDKDLPLMDVRTQTEQIEDIMAPERLFSVLTASFGVLALVLACIGIYGLMAYTVARRTNEIGLRMALGAQRGQVLRMVLGETSLLAIGGVTIGVGVALVVTHFLTSLLYGIKNNDPMTLAAASLLLLTTALAAGWLPAMRAARVQPMQALRHE